MKLSIAALLLALATAAGAAETPPTGTPATTPRIAFLPLVDDYFPPASRTSNEQGTTTVKICYDGQGKPVEITVTESSMFPRLDQAALRWGRAVRITPSVSGGQPQPGCLVVPVKFSLEKT
jgi:periplasmic protein TonB